VTENCVAPSDGSPPATCELDPDFKPVTDVTALSEIVRTRFPNLDVDLENIDPIHDFRLQPSGTVVKCTKPHRGDLDANGNYTEKPGFYVINRGLTSVGAQSYSDGKCTYDEAANTIAAVCNNKPRDIPCVTDWVEVAGADPFVGECRVEGTGKEVRGQNFKKMKRAVITQPQGEGAACQGVDDIGWRRDGAQAFVRGIGRCNSTGGEKFTTGDCALPICPFTTRPPEPIV
jgi:hypothetical protein